MKACELMGGRRALHLCNAVERARETTMKRPPNILYIHSHDTGRYIQPYGHAVPTPHLQKLAEQGVLFRQAYCCGPTCSPSRAALLTGTCPHTNGMLGLAHRGFVLNDLSKHWVRTLKRAGYVTALSGVQHIRAGKTFWQDIGYDRYLGPRESAEHHAVEFLEHVSEQPFFLSVGFFETHRTFADPGPHEDARTCLPPCSLPDAPETRNDMAALKATARILDHKMGKVLAALERTGLAGNTLVICTADHGIAFPGMKCTLTDGGIGVMLIMRGPASGAAGPAGLFSGGKVCDALVSHLDVYPTLCDVVGIEPPAWLQGTSLMPLMTGERDSIRDAIFAEVNYHAAYEPMRCVRTPRWKHIRRFDGRERRVLPNTDDSPSKSYLLTHGWAERPVEQEMLYDVVFDPAEAHNRVRDPDLAGVLRKLRDRLDRWMKETDDPLLRGPVPAPAGAKVNDPDGSSPGEPPRVVTD